MKELTNIQVKGKTSFKLPKGGKILKKQADLRIEEIENGFLLRKEFEIKWMDKEGQQHWEHFSRTWFSEKNPVQINEKELSLADKID